jgi:hypothetical protein
LVLFKNTAMASPSPTTVPTRAKGGRSESVSIWGAGKLTCSRGAGITARCGGRREARNIGRSRVAESTENGIDQSGLPLGSAGSLAPRFGLSICVTGATSTTSEASPVRSESKSEVADVAAGRSGGRQVKTMPDAMPRQNVLRQPTISLCPVSAWPLVEATEPSSNLSTTSHAINPSNA